MRFLSKTTSSEYQFDRRFGQSSPTPSARVIDFCIQQGVRTKFSLCNLPQHARSACDEASASARYAADAAAGNFRALPIPSRLQLSRFYLQFELYWASSRERNKRIFFSSAISSMQIEFESELQIL